MFKRPSYSQIGTNQSREKRSETLFANAVMVYKQRNAGLRS